MTARRRIALYFDLGFEQDRHLFARLAPYMRRKRANEIIKAALQAWIEREERIEGPPASVLAPGPTSSVSEDVAVVVVSGANPGSTGGIRDLVDRIAAPQPEQPPAAGPAKSQPSARSAQTDGSVASLGVSSSAPVASRPRLGRLM